MSTQMYTTPLSGRYAIVTGGTRGIGKGIALDFARKGAAGIAITYASSKSRAEEVVEESHKLGCKKVVAIKADLLSSDYGEIVVREALAGLETKDIHVLVNNAAALEIDFNTTFENENKATFDKLFHGNVWGPVILIRAVLPHLAPTGRIINISSDASVSANTDAVMTYGASKAALDSYTRSLAKKYAALKKITVNSVLCGPVRTEGTQELYKRSPAFEEMMSSRATAEKRIAEVQDVAAIVSFLASEEGRWVSGHLMPAHGGSGL